MNYGGIVWRSIIKVLKRIENPDYIMIFTDSNISESSNVSKNQDNDDSYSSWNSTLTVELPRMALHFEVDQALQIKSKEFRGMKVAKQQKFGTLVGLQQGLLLDSLDPNNDCRILLMPHGSVSIPSMSSLPSGTHQQVVIDTTTLKTPEYFTFEVDHRLRRITAGQGTAWLYLSYLYATCSHVLPDPFTGMTGTESSLLLLQSGHCWSCKPFDQESKDIINGISLLSPRRGYYPEHLRKMEIVTWPKNLSPLLAHEAFYIITEKLLHDSERLSFCFEENAPTSNTTKMSMNKNHKEMLHRELAEKNYRQSSIYYTPQALISVQFLENYGSMQTINTIQHIPANRFAKDDNRLRSIRVLSYLSQCWTIFSRSQTPSLVDCLTYHTTQRRGFQPGSENEIISGSTIHKWLLLDNFEDSWLNLYHYAVEIETEEQRCEWAMFLSTLLFKGVDLNQILILHNIAVHSDLFKNIKIPTHEVYNSPSQHIPNERFVLDLFIKSKYDESLCVRGDPVDYNRISVIQAKKLTEVLKSMWPVNSVNESHFKDVDHSLINLPIALPILNDHLQHLYINHDLIMFLRKIEQALSTLYQKSNISIDINPNLNFNNNNQLELSL